MSNYNSLKNAIDANIKQNGNQEITGQVLNSVLNQMVTTLGAGYQFAGVATTATNPGTPDAKVFYIATQNGVYTNFDGIENAGDILILYNTDDGWKYDSLNVAKKEELAEIAKRIITFKALEPYETVNNSAIAKSGQVLVDSTYLGIGVVLKYNIQANSIYRLSFINPPFHGYMKVAIYNNDTFINERLLPLTSGSMDDNILSFINTYGANKMFISVRNTYVGAVSVVECPPMKYKEPSVKRANIEDGAINNAKLDEALQQAIENAQPVSLYNVPTLLLAERQTNKSWKAVKIGETIEFIDNNYRNVLKYDISNLDGNIYVNNIFGTNTDDGAIVCDSENKIIDILTVSSTQAYRSVNVIMGKYPDAKYLYVSESNNSARPDTTATLYPLSNPDYIKAALYGIKSLFEQNKIAQLAFLVIYQYTTGNDEIGAPVTLGYDQYRNCAIVNIWGLKSEKILVHNIQSQGEFGITLVGADGNVVGKITTAQNQPTDAIVDLSQYENAVYMYINYTGSSPLSLTTLRTSKNIFNDIYGIEKQDLPYTNISEKQFGTITIGSKIAFTDTTYRRIVKTDLTNVRGKLHIANTLGGENVPVVVLTDSNDIVLAKFNQMDSNTYVQNLEIDLEKYPTAKYAYALCPPINQVGYDPVIIYSYFEGIKQKVEFAQNGKPQHGIILLHFDSTLSENDKRMELLEEYGIKNVSWCIASSVINESTGNWVSETAKNNTLNALRRGDDFGLYPERIASQFNETGWINWINNRLSQFAACGIYNVTGFMCGRLDINDDLLNATKKTGFKIIRGGGSKDAQSVDTYDYTDDNIFMPITPTSDTFFVNSAFYMAAGTDAERIKSWISEAYDRNRAISLFAHAVSDDPFDTINITESKLRSILSFIREKIDAGMVVMTWRQYFKLRNQLKGDEWDYNRLLNMSMPKDL